MAKTIRFTVEMSDNEAWELAQFLKRASWEQFRQCAVDDEEANVIRDAVVRLEAVLKEAGYASR